MSRLVKILLVVGFIASSIITFYSCEKKSSPVVTISELTDIKPTAATVVANVVDEGGTPVTSKGICWNTEGNPTIFNHRTSEEGSQQVFQSSVTLLSPNTIYYVRAYATNSEGVGYSSQFTLSTPDQPDPPEVAGMLISYTMSTANIRGSVIKDGGAKITALGVCWSTNSKPVKSDAHTSDEATDGEFVGRITGIMSNTKYYARAYAVNESGTSYGTVVSFTTLSEYEGKVLDADGNEYIVLSIGSQKWLREDLKTTRYDNGDLIGTPVPWNKVLTGEDSPKYQWPCGADESYVPEYGRVYTWYVTQDVRGICPQGFRVPSDNDWHRLVLFLDPDALLQILESTTAGGKLKEIGLTHWNSSGVYGVENINVGAKDEAGFKAIPGGTTANTWRTGCNWWTSTWLFGNYSYARGVSFVNTDINRADNFWPGSFTNEGHKIRCVK
jgi:uncharacterized protein (TIGR02145 family)